MFKKVDKSSLEMFKFMLETYVDHESLLKYFNENIMKEDQQNINELKKTIYALMKSSEGDKSREYYSLYQNLKNGLISYSQAKEALNLIA
jgi:hypothetical protein